MMEGMNPFDQPPTAPPVSLDPPSGAGRPGADGPRRGRMALAALAAAGLVGGGIVVAGQFASADEPSLGAAAAVEEPADDTTDEPADDTTDEPADDTTDEPADDTTDDGGEEPADDADRPIIDGEIVIDDGDGDPFVLDLGELGECVGPILRGGPMFDRDGEGPRRRPFDEDFHRRMEEFLDGLDLDGLGEMGDDGVRIFGSDDSTVTIVGPDGVEVIDLGEDDATVTIEQRDGELTIETEGDVTVSDVAELPDLGELLPDLGELEGGEHPMPALPGLPDLGSCLDDLDE